MQGNNNKLYHLICAPHLNPLPGRFQDRILRLQLVRPMCSIHNILQQQAKDIENLRSETSEIGLTVYEVMLFKLQERCSLHLVIF